jgi:hypothetical protein
MDEDKVKSVGEITQELKVLLEEMTEMVRNLESEDEEGAWFMLDTMLYDMKSSIGEKYNYGGGTGWIYELYKDR